MEAKAIDSADGLIRDLAEKLGTTVDHLWPKYVEYVYVDALSWIIVNCTMALLLFFVSIRFWRKNFEVLESDGDKIPVGKIVSVALVLFAGSLAWFSIGECLPAILNPDGYALQELLEQATE